MKVSLCLCLLFLLFLFTLSPTIGLIDSGELATGCYLLNILHPTGYPLFTILGRIITLVPFGGVVNRLAVLSALLSVAGVGLFIILGKNLGFSLLPTTAIALLLAVSPPVWSVSTDVEVYSLTFLLVVILWWALTRAISITQQPKVRISAQVAFLGYIAGLVLTNHMSGLFAVLGAGLAFLLKWRKSRLRRLPVFGLFFLLGLSPYLFLLIRARCGPLLAWGNPINWERFWWHITGRQYQVWMFSTSFDAVLKNAGRGLGIIARTFGFALLPLVIYGWLKLFRQKSGLTLGLSASAILAFIYAINYAIPDIEGYYIPVIVPLAIFAVAGVESLNQLLAQYRSSPFIAQAGNIASFLVVIIMLIINFPLQNRRDHWVAYDLAMNTLNSADSNAIIITDWWDCYAPIFYLQTVEKVRADVCVIDKELLRRSWYFNYLARQYPWLIDRSQRELQQFLIHLDRFEHRQPYDPQAIQESYITLLRSFFLNNPERPAYTTFPREVNIDAQQMLSGFNLVPTGLLFQIRTDTIIPEFDYSRLKVRIPKFKIHERSRINLDRYRFFVRSRLELLRRRGRLAEARALADWERSHLLQP